MLYVGIFQNKFTLTKFNTYVLDLAFLVKMLQLNFDLQHLGGLAPTPLEILYSLVNSLPSLKNFLYH